VSALRDACPKHSDFITGYNSSLNFNIAPASSAILLGRDRSTASVTARTKQKLAQLNGDLGSNKELSLQKKVKRTA
jgi:hypothetical protein